jgi:hypothetical protein
MGGASVGSASASAAAAAGLIGGFAVARYSGRRSLGGVVFAVAGSYCAAGWARAAGWPRAAVLSAGYAAATGVSHPLAKRIGAWPSVLAVTAATVVGSELAGRR